MLGEDCAIWTIESHHGSQILAKVDEKENLPVNVLDPNSYDRQYSFHLEVQRSSCGLEFYYIVRTSSPVSVSPSLPSIRHVHACLIHSYELRLRFYAGSRYST